MPGIPSPDALPKAQSMSGKCHLPVQPQDDKFSIDYSLGQVSGHVALDTVSLGQPPIRVTQQAMGLATDSTADFSTTSCDGVFVSLCIQSWAAF